jgi:flagellar biosynthetic protein FliO
VFSDAEWNAAQKAVAPAASTDLGWGTALALFIGLLVVVGLAVGLGWAAKRLNAKRLLGGKGRHLQVIETVALAPKRSLALVRLGGQVLVLGVGEHDISQLAQLPAEVLDRPAPPAAPAAPTPFAQALEQAGGTKP